MPKLSTDAIRTMIHVWLSTPEVLTRIEEEFKYNWENGLPDRAEDPNPDGFGPKYKRLPDESDDAHRERVKAVWLETWADGKQWKREKKERLKDDECGLIREGRDSAYEPNGTFEFNIDYVGGSDPALVNVAAINPDFKTKCWWRTFYPNNLFADNFRLEVVTTPDDDAVVGWTIIVD